MERDIKKLREIQQSLEEVRDRGLVSLSTIQGLISKAREQIREMEAGQHQHPPFLRADKALREASQRALESYAEDAVYSAHAAVTVFLYEKGGL
ncbi:hypothetical protein [Rufibacter tibetensis]|uniref:HEPN domain-containing protein n=1 Tax=Rufibacter tibetensis TaxID=512763 RepID=A0A0P0CI13_9BACT|nr:hypothetical protein [Rufibacter tibetensis]ALJ01661.1 hypothetical protein DC20_21615 [Rufibacter tibetensis]